MSLWESPIWSVVVVPTLSFIGGVVAKEYVTQALRAVRAAAETRKRRREWAAANDYWAKVHGLSPGLLVVQNAWRGDAFREEEIVITIEGTYSAPAHIRQIQTAHEPAWHAKKLKNNVQIGISAVVPHRTSDDPEGITHQLFLRGQRIRYFEFLASNRRLLDATSDEAVMISSVAGEPDYLTPVRDFANPLSVGLTLFCEGGECLVLMRRTTGEASGGTYFGGAIFNAVGETCNPTDASAQPYDGHLTVSPWNTAKRGLWEEVGFSASDTGSTTIVLHSFVFDLRIRDYKFFGHARCDLSRAVVKQRWTDAPDKAENKSIFFVDLGSLGQRQEFLDAVVRERRSWASEALLSTIRAMLHAKLVDHKMIGLAMSRAA